MSARPKGTDMRETRRNDNLSPWTHDHVMGTAATGRQSYACAQAVVARDPWPTANTLRDRLAVHDEIVHAAIEIHQRA